MGVQSRKANKEDTESLLPVQHQADDEPKTRRRPALELNMSTSAIVMFGLLFFLAKSQFDFDFPFPSKPEKPEPHFVKEGLARCKEIARPPPHFKRFDAERKQNDRFAQGTKPVWLKNGTVWTGEKGGEEVLYGYDVLLEDGVVRKISKGEALNDSFKSITEVELDGAWVTPGELKIGTVSACAHYRYCRHALASRCRCVAPFEGSRRHELAQGFRAAVAAKSRRLRHARRCFQR